MINKRRSIISTGWLIIGIVMLITGASMIFLANSFQYELNQLEEYTTSDTNNAIIKEISNHISTNIRFLVIASLVVIVIGIIMCVEWVSFSKFIKKYMEK